MFGGTDWITERLEGTLMNPSTWTGKHKRDVVYYLTIRKPGGQEEEHESVKDLSLAEDAEKCENCQF